MTTASTFVPTWIFFIYAVCLYFIFLFIVYSCFVGVLKQFLCLRTCTIHFMLCCEKQLVYLYYQHTYVRTSAYYIYKKKKFVIFKEYRMYVLFCQVNIFTWQKTMHRRLCSIFLLCYYFCTHVFFFHSFFVCFFFLVFWCLHFFICMWLNWMLHFKILLYFEIELIEDVKKKVVNLPVSI